MLADIHVIPWEGRLEWRSELINSLRDQPCVVHLSPPVPEQIGLARSAAFRLGESEFVGYADDDDLVEPGAVQTLLDALQQNPEAVGAYTDEILVTDQNKKIRDGLSTGRDYTLRHHLGSLQHVHHLWVGRRSSVEKHIDTAKGLQYADHWALTCLMRLDGPWVHVPMIGYRWRQHGGNSHTRADYAAVKDMAKYIVARWIEAGITTPEDMPAMLLR